MAQEPDKRDFDIVIFGATGVTGKYALEDLSKTLEKENQDLVWAVAGRSLRKLEETLKTSSRYLNKNLENMPLIEANVDDYASVLSMCRRTRVVVNCVGPYSRYGETVVKACIEGRCHEVDLSGETQYMEEMQLKYHQEAEEAGVFIVSASGAGFVPFELGLYYLRDHFEGELHSVECFWDFKRGPRGFVLNQGSWVSVIHAMNENTRVLLETRKQLYQKYYATDKFPEFKHKLVQRKAPSTAPVIGKLAIPWFEGEAVANRTQLHNFVHRKERPIQTFHYMVMHSWLHIVYVGLVGLVCGALSRCSWGLRMVETYPRLFSGGLASAEGPTREQVEGGSFEITFVGRGWAEKLAEPMDESAEAPDKVIVGRMRGPETCYLSTTICLNQSAIALLKDREGIPFKGGVLTPGLVFRDTTLLQRLNRHSLVFDIIKQ